MPSSAQMLSQWIEVLPSLPNRSKLRSVFTSPQDVGMKLRSPRLDWRTLKTHSPSRPQPGLPGQATGICEGRSVAFQLGFMRLKS